jgi:hypothetical protein
MIVVDTFRMLAELDVPPERIRYKMFRGTEPPRKAGLERVAARYDRGMRKA